MSVTYARKALLLASLFSGLAHAAPPYMPDANPGHLPEPRSVWPEHNPALGERDWREANDNVGRFQRGHIDLLRWEAEHLPQSADDAGDNRPLLTPMAAVRAAFALQPGRFATTGMSDVERRTADVAAVDLARSVQQAWLRAVAAQIALSQAETALEAASIADELAARMTATGNWGRERLVSKRLDLADAAIALTQAEHTAFAAREALIRVAGLSGDAARFSLPTELPPLPQTLPDASQVEREALQNHPRALHVAAQAQRAEQALSDRAESMWDQAMASALPAPEDDARITAPSAAPLIDLRRARIDHETMNAVGMRAEATREAVARRSEAREAWHAYASAHKVATVLQQRTVPLTAELEEDAVLRYNGMFKSTWDLIDAARARIAAESAAVLAQRDFWLSHINLHAVMAGADSISDGMEAEGPARGSAGGH